MKVIRKSINEISELEKNQINSFIEKNDGLIFHESNFNEIASQAFKTEISYFLAFDNNKMVGICPIHSINTKLTKQSYSNPSQFEIPYGGWVFDKNKTSLRDLWRKMNISWNESLTYWSSFLTIDFPHIKGRREFHTGLVNLKMDLEDIWMKELTSTQRNKIRRAQKNGIEIIIEGIDSINIFYKLLMEMNRKSEIHSKQIKYYKDIFQKYSFVNAAIFFAAKDKKIISCLFLVGNSNVIHYWQGATVFDVEKNLYQNELLHWEAIKWSQKRGSSYYDLCVIEPERLPSIAQFKMGFTKKLIPFYYISKKTFVFKVLNKIQNVFTN